MVEDEPGTGRHIYWIPSVPLRQTPLPISVDLACTPERVAGVEAWSGPSQSTAAKGGQCTISGSERKAQLLIRRTIKVFFRR